MLAAQRSSPQIPPFCQQLWWLIPNLTNPVAPEGTASPQGLPILLAAGLSRAIARLQPSTGQSWGDGTREEELPAQPFGEGGFCILSPTALAPAASS